MDILLVVILAVLCGTVGFLGLTLVGQVILSALGVGKERYFSWKLAAAILGLPAAGAGGWIGVQQGMELITPPGRSERPVYVPQTQPAMELSPLPTASQTKPASRPASTQPE